MKKALLIGVVLWLAATGAAWASGQVDEPPPGQPPSTQTPEETPDGGVALGVYLSAGKSLYAYDFARLNHTLGVGGAGTFAQYIDDWEFELVFAATQLGFFGFGGRFGVLSPMRFLLAGECTGRAPRLPTRKSQAPRPRL